MPGVSQTVKVRAINRKGPSDWSEEITIIAGTVPSKVTTL